MITKSLFSSTLGLRYEIRVPAFPMSQNTSDVVDRGSLREEVSSRARRSLRSRLVLRELVIRRKRQAGLALRQFVSFFVLLFLVGWLVGWMDGRWLMDCCSLVGLVAQMLHSIGTTFNDHGQ